MVCRRPTCRGFIIILLTLCPAAMPAAMAEDHDHNGQNSDLVLFPALTFTHNSLAVPGLVQDKLQPELNVFYSTDKERWRFLAEFLARDTEQDLERLQVGWLADPALTVWVGRFHSPVGFWTSEHHHGAYLQPTINRPGILAFEDEGGVLPTHITGALAEGTLYRERGQFNYAVGLGSGPMFKTDELQPLDILRMQNKGGNSAVAARLSYRPDTENAGEFGVSAAYTRIPFTGTAFDRSDQTVVSAFYNREGERFRFIGEIFRVSDRLSAAGTSSRNSFTALYLQPEYQVHSNWSVYGRLETTSRTRDDPYLNLQPLFITARALAGARVDVTRNQVLKLELSRNEKQDTIRFSQIGLQWSMVWP